MKKQQILKRKIIRVLRKQGFKINPHLRPKGYGKRTLKRLQKNARMEQIFFHRKFLLENIEKVKSYCRNGEDVEPNKIVLELREVKSGSLEDVLFRWWNLIWWSIPYQHPYGRQMRFLLWDVTHDAPFGLFALQSPVLKMSVRDEALGIPNKELDVWVNKSMNAQRLGALPPYNQLLGGKMVALAMTSNEIRDAYRKKYKNYISIIERRKLKPELLFITTTSAFGKSSLYNRLKYNGDVAAECLGYTQGSGTFHIPEELYQDILDFLAKKGIDVARGFGHGPSRKLKLLSIGFKYLKIQKYEFHGIKREFYLFPLVKNLRDVIQLRIKPIWYNRPFNRLEDYWKERWAIPRAERKTDWRNFQKEKFFKTTEKMLEKLKNGKI